MRAIDTVVRPRNPHRFNRGDTVALLLETSSNVRSMLRLSLLLNASQPSSLARKPDCTLPV